MDKIVIFDRHIFMKYKERKYQIHTFIHSIWHFWNRKTTQRTKYFVVNFNSKFHKHKKQHIFNDNKYI